MFKGLLHKLDSKLEAVFDSPTQRCDSCGYLYPMYLIYYSSDGGEYCKPCLTSFKYTQDDSDEE